MEADYRIGEWLAQTRSNTLTKGSTSVHVEPKVMEGLTMLARREGEVLTKEEIIAEVWSGTFVTDEVLWRCIFELRSIFGDDAKEPQFIQTIPKRGYKLIAAVSRADQCDCRDAKQPDNSVPAACIGTVAVLPFADMSSEQNLGFFCDGVAEEIIDRLTRVQGLRVAARTSSFRFRAKAEDARTIGKQLGVRAFVEGSVRRSTGKLRITVQLICALDGCHIWSERYECGTRNPFGTYDEIARSVAGKMPQTDAAAGR